MAKSQQCPHTLIPSRAKATIGRPSVPFQESGRTMSTMCEPHLFNPVGCTNCFSAYNCCRLKDLLKDIESTVRFRKEYEKQVDPASLLPAHRKPCPLRMCETMSEGPLAFLGLTRVPLISQVLSRQSQPPNRKCTILVARLS